MYSQIRKNLLLHQSPFIFTGTAFGSEIECIYFKKKIEL